MKSPKEAIAEFASLANPSIYGCVRSVKMIWPRPQGNSVPCCPDGLVLEYYNNIEQDKALRIQFFDICKLCLPMDAYRGEPELYTGMQRIGRIEIHDVSDRQLNGKRFYVEGEEFHYDDIHLYCADFHAEVIVIEE